MTHAKYLHYFLSPTFPIQVELADIPDYKIIDETKKALISSRVEGFRYELIDKNDNKLGDISTVQNCSTTGSIYNTIRTGGKLRLMESEIRDINFFSDRVRPVYRLKTPKGWLEWPLGVFLLASPSKTTDGKFVERGIEIYDKLLVLAQDKLDKSYTVETAVVATDAIRTVIQETGETKINITPSQETLPSPKTWSPGTSRLRIVNDLLQSINYFSIWVDGAGNYRGEPYVPPGQRAPVWTFADNAEGIYAPSVSVDADYFNVPNKVILVVSNPDQDLLVATKKNEDSGSPFSYQSRGRWITEYREDMEATSQSALNSRAQRILAEGMQVSEVVGYDHAWVPVGLNESVEFKNTKLGLSARYTVVNQSYNLKAGELIKASIRRVVT